MAGNSDEREWKTRKKRIDPLHIDLRLDALGWVRSPYWVRAAGNTTPLHGHRTDEEETDNGPADYALWLNKDLIGIVEAKEVTTGPQNVLTQADRYTQGARGTRFDFRGLKVRLLYSTNGEVFWFHDPLNRSRRVAGFHTPNAFRELLDRDFDADCAKLLGLPHDHPKLRRRSGPPPRFLRHGGNLVAQPRWLPRRHEERRVNFPLDGRAKIQSANEEP